MKDLSDNIKEKYGDKLNDDEIRDIFGMAFRFFHEFIELFAEEEDDNEMYT